MSVSVSVTQRRDEAGAADHSGRGEPPVPTTQSSEERRYRTSWIPRPSSCSASWQERSSPSGDCTSDSALPVAVSADGPRADEHTAGHSPLRFDRAERTGMMRSVPPGACIRAVHATRRQRESSAMTFATILSDASLAVIASSRCTASKHVMNGYELLRHNPCRTHERTQEPTMM